MLEQPSLILVKRSYRRARRLISRGVMINEHSQKLRVKAGYYTHSCLVGVSLNLASPRSHATNAHEPCQSVWALAPKR